MTAHVRLSTRDNQIALDHRDAIARPTTFNAETRTVEATIATTTPVARRDQRGEFFEVLDPAGLDLESSRGASVLDAHRQDGVASILGALDTVRVAGNEVIGTIRFSTRPEIAAVVEDVRGGIIASLSVGYDVQEWREGSDAQGRRTKTATRWRIREASFVPVGADPNARTRNAPAPRSARAEINRSIRELCTRAGVAQNVVDDLIDNERSIDDARGVVLDHMIARGNGVSLIRSAHNVTTVDNPEARVRAMSDALYTRIAPSFRPSPQAQQFIGMSCAELARECLRRSGAYVTALGAGELVTRALQTTSDYPLILGDVVGRTLRDAYTAAPSGIRQLCRQTTVPDFRERSSLMLDSSGFKLEEVREAGEFKHGSFVESGERYRAKTYGKIFSISRQSVVNDDLGAFSDIARRLGAAAAAFENQQLVDLLVSNAGVGPTMSDTKAFFHTDHGNLAGSGATIGDTTLNTARVAMRRQKAPSGELIGVSPQYVLVPPELETAAQKQLTAIQATETANTNPFSILTLIVESRLTDDGAWYVAAAPTQMDGIIYCYLAGASGPQVESQAGFEVDGIMTRVRLDFGCAAIDWRGWYRNPGA